MVPFSLCVFRVSRQFFQSYLTLFVRHHFFKEIVILLWAFIYLCSLVYPSCYSSLIVSPAPCRSYCQEFLTSCSVILASSASASLKARLIALGLTLNCPELHVCDAATAPPRNLPCVPSDPFTPFGTYNSSSGSSVDVSSQCFEPDGLASLSAYLLALNDTAASIAASLDFAFAFSSCDIVHSVT